MMSAYLFSFLPLFHNVEEQLINFSIFVLGLATSMNSYSSNFPPNILLGNYETYRKVERIL